ncbi:hypothetical protein ACWDR0_05880 [Streptomyces sp. NPDC003691]
MSLFSWFGRKKKAGQEPEPGQCVAVAAGAAESAEGAAGPGAEKGGCALAADGGAGAGTETAKSADGAEAPAPAGVEIPRQQSAGDVEGSEAGEGARQ